MLVSHAVGCPLDSRAPDLGVAVTAQIPDLPTAGSRDDSGGTDYTSNISTSSKSTTVTQTTVALEGASKGQVLVGELLSFVAALDGAGVTDDEVVSIADDGLVYSGSKTTES